jgi:hypothetical protein
VVRTRVVLFALLTGLTITGYTLLDDHGVELLAPPVYLAVETGVGVLILARRLEANPARGTRAYRRHSHRLDDRDRIAAPYQSCCTRSRAVP